MKQDGGSGRVDIAELRKPEEFIGEKTRFNLQKIKVQSIKSIYHPALLATLKYKQVWLKVLIKHIEYS